jgi:hypothetical protein
MNTRGKKEIYYCPSNIRQLVKTIPWSFVTDPEIRLW